MRNRNSDLAWAHKILSHKGTKAARYLAHRKCCRHGGWGGRGSWDSLRTGDILCLASSSYTHQREGLTSCWAPLPRISLQHTHATSTHIHWQTSSAHAQIPLPLKHSFLNSTRKHTNMLAVPPGREETCELFISASLVFQSGTCQKVPWTDETFKPTPQRRVD